jgi:hypothetical protein
MEWLECTLQTWASTTLWSTVLFARSSFFGERHPCFCSLTDLLLVFVCMVNSIRERRKPGKDGKEPEVETEKCSIEYVSLQSALDQSWTGVRVTKHQSKLFFRYLGVYPPNCPSPALLVHTLSLELLSSLYIHFVWVSSHCLYHRVVFGNSRRKTPMLSWSRGRFTRP